MANYFKRLRRAMSRLVRFILYKVRRTPFAFQRLPLELQLACFSFLPLETLIISRSVSSTWRSLLRYPSTSMHPTRRRLYEIYLMILDNPRPADALSKQYLSNNLVRNFDRELYLQYLQRNCCGGNIQIPEEFEIWVLEWPAALVINGLWPGLPYTECFQDTTATAGSSLRFGKNHLAKGSQVQLFYINESTAKESNRKLAALLIWMTGWSVIRVRDCTTGEYNSVQYRGARADSDPHMVRTFLKLNTLSLSV
ncbi:hypothetical protein CVT26_009065 [Gymnopilus dilepis]|uniref:F-box domain-containing protein n=1 Tax=Gymnopilus dilepis TaxID=231916 RepID=A0A409YR59_9AGAR|nr:hypothetical protein CVT26_009065 [Gymnopilus dilepis]